MTISAVSKITGIPLPTVYRKIKDVLETAEEWAKAVWYINREIQRLEKLKKNKDRKQVDYER